MQESKQEVKKVASLLKMTEFLPSIFSPLKCSISLKNRHFIVQERFNKLIYGINTIIKCGT